MTLESDIIKDLLQLGQSAVDALLGARPEIKSALQSAKRRMTASNEGYISRDEFEAAFAMIAKARDAQEKLDARLEQIESVLGITADRPTKKAPAKKKTRLPSVKQGKAKRKSK